jgi:omega-6 fatty acid desaturase (delta-12 desaturase)
MEQTENSSHWLEVVSRYNTPNLGMSIWQIINSLGPYLLLWVAMYYSLQISYFLTLGLAVLAAAFLVRVFIIFHDCGHGSFFPQQESQPDRGNHPGQPGIHPL